VALPLGWMLAHWGGMGPAGIWAGFMLALVGAAIALTLRFWRQTAVLGGAKSL
jgi:Na+-driven multidrug efflux pump